MAHILYTSKQTRPIAEADLNDILTVSRQRNLAEAISGMLLSDNESFLQLLEGDKEAIHRLYARIKLDTRHEDARILLEDDLSERLFPDWAMGYAGSCGIQNFKFVDQQLRCGRVKGKRELPYRLLSLYRLAMTLPMKLRVPIVGMPQQQ